MCDGIWFFLFKEEKVILEQQSTSINLVKIQGRHWILHKKCLKKYISII